MKKQRSSYFVALACLTLTLEGCLAPPLLWDGQRSGLSAAGAGARNHLVFSPTPGILPAYHPASCVYDERQGKSLGATEHKKITLSLATVAGNKLFVHIKKLDDESTALMDRTGKLLDLNVLALDDKQRITTESFDPYAAEKVKGYQSILTTNAHVINDITAILPHFTAVPSRPGTAVANVMVEKGEIWGVYVYRGVLSYHGVAAELFDLIHVQNGGPVVRGFLLFDTQHMLPLLLNVNMGHGTYELEQLECPPAA